MSERRIIGEGVEIDEDLNGYAVVFRDGKVVKRFTNSREDALGKAERFAWDMMSEIRNAGKGWFA
jgi:hypothetical protein